MWGGGRTGRWGSRPACRARPVRGGRAGVVAGWKVERVGMGGDGVEGAGFQLMAGDGAVGDAGLRLGVGAEDILLGVQLRAGDDGCDEGESQGRSSHRSFLWVGES